MRRAIFFLALLAVALGLWWKRDDAMRLASDHVPFLRAYLSERPVQNVAASSRPAPPAVPVVLGTAEKKPLPVTIDAVGTVQSIATVSVKPRIDSQIATVEVAEGALVKEGDLLFTLDARALKAQLAQADAQIEKDKAQLEQGRRDLARAEDLLAKRISTEVQRDTARTNVKVLEAQLASDEAQRANLAALVSYTEIRAPVSGRIGSIAYKEGSTVRAGDAQAIATVNQIDPIYVSFAVPQSLFADLRQALQAGKVRVDTRMGTSTVSGMIAFVENTVDLATGTVLAKATMPNKGETLWPGAFVPVQVVLGIDKDAIAVPSAAVQIGQRGAYVFVVQDGRAALRPVTVARTVGSESVIASGLVGGEQIAVDGQLRLVDGAAVQIQSPKPTAKGGGVAKTTPETLPDAVPRRS
jgi:multidrug efflux system membrane fusion protein